ncbi:hypothetical protein VZC37_07410 [Gordonia sp. LSe1-13]|uniref:Uncharacterized protein n=1 Tax=Gordonia sesuvii TaxID=3116777 RepID=A0ABU7MBY1_9ACTN|nr:hypothetical protein [Gordonia sp. LSe1-13]
MEQGKIATVDNHSPGQPSMSHRPTRAVLACGIAGGAIFALVITFAFILFETMNGEAQIDLRKELFKSLTQLVVVGFIGAMVSAMIQYFRDQREHRTELIKEQRDQEKITRARQYEVFAEIVTAYHQFKTVRRNLRMIGILDAIESGRLNSLTKTQIADLRSGMLVLSDVDLTLEQIDRSLTVDPMFEDSEALQADLYPMRDYVEALVDEWELRGPQFLVAGAAPDDIQLPILHAFLRKIDDYGKLGFYYRSLGLDTPNRDDHSLSWAGYPLSPLEFGADSKHTFHGAAKSVGEVQKKIERELSGISKS